MTRKTETKTLTPSSVDIARRKTLETQSDEDVGDQQKHSETTAKSKKKAEKSKEQYLNTEHTQTEKSSTTSVKSSSS